MLSSADSSVSTFQRAFEETRAARAALAVEELVAIDLDVLEVVSTILGRLPRARALREEVIQQLGRPEPLAALDALEPYALALGHAHVRYMSTSTSDRETLIAAVEDRQRAFTILAIAYDRVRRAAVYLRWTPEDEGTSYLPSLWEGEVGSLAEHVAATRQWS